MDYQAAKPVDPEVFETMKPYFMDKFGNPSSLHLIGDVATDVLEESRKKLMGFINAQKEREIIFTSGATESNNLAIIGYAVRNKRKGKHIIISEVEHISIHNIAKYLQKNGRIKKREAEMLFMILKTYFEGMILHISGGITEFDQKNYLR